MKRTCGVRAVGLLLLFLAVAQPAAADGMAVTLLDGGEAIGPPGLCPLDRVDLSAELGDDEATVRETRVYPVLDPAALLGPTGAPLEATAAARVELFKSLPPGAELISLQIGGENASGELLEPEAADDLRRELVLRLGDPAPLRELGTAMWVMAARELAAGQRTVEVVSELRMPFVARGTLEGVSVPLDWHEGPVRSVGIDVHTATDAPLRALYAPYHGLQLHDRQEHEATASFSRNGVASAPPIEILRSTGEEAVRLDLLPFHHGDAGEGGFLLALLSATTEPPEDAIAGRDLIIALDISGSMQGQKITQAKDALDGVLAGLTARDRFALTTFANAIDSFEDEVVPATAENVTRARNFVSDLIADGGTNIDGALRDAIGAVSGDRERARYVVLITDGIPTDGEENIDAIVANARNRNERGARIFTFGIGSDVNTVLLDRLADEGAGDALYIRNAGAVQATVERFFEQLEAPVLGNPRLDLEVFGASDPYPATLPDVFAGGTVTVAMRYEAPGDGEITLVGAAAGQPTASVHEASLPELAIDSPYVPGIWAARRIGNLLEEVKLGDDDPQLVEEALALASRYGVVTDFTFFETDDAGDTRMAYATVSQAAVGDIAVGTSSSLNEVTKTDTMEAFVAPDVRAAFDRSLPLQGGYFTDEKLEDGPEWTDLRFGSELYFELAQGEAALGAHQLLAAAPNLRFELAGRSFRVTDPVTYPEQDAVLPEESARIPDAAFEVEELVVGTELSAGRALEQDEAEQVIERLGDRDGIEERSEGEDAGAASGGSTCSAGVGAGAGAGLTAWLVAFGLLWLRRRRVYRQTP